MMESPGAVLDGMILELGEMDSAKNERAKGLTLDTMEKGRGWTTSTKNEDYNLVLIHAANSGYAARGASDTGSYLIHLFVNTLMQNVGEKTQTDLAAVCEYIQDTLNDEGKQLPESTFNNSTRTLRLRVNRK